MPPQPQIGYAANKEAVSVVKISQPPVQSARRSSLIDMTPAVSAKIVAQRLADRLAGCPHPLHQHVHRSAVMDDAALQDQ